LRAAPLALAALALALFLPQQVRLAEQKPFGQDEGFEWGFNCAQPALALIRDGARPQCSPTPGYYLLEKAVARVIAIRDERILVAYRALSLGAAAALVLALGVGLGARLGLLAAGAGLASLLGQPLFHLYAAESRPYALALCLFALVLLVLAARAAPDASPGWGWTAAVVGACLGSSLVLLTGAAQAVAACAVFVLLVRLQGASLRSRRVAVAVILMIACAACAAYYRWRSTCLASDAGPHSVWGRQGRYLVAQVFALIWTENVWANLLAVLGCAAPVWAWRRRHDAGRSHPYVLALGGLVLAQLAFTAALAAQVARADYYFLPRLFLHLIVCRALLVALGVWMLLDLLARTRVSLSARIATGLLTAAAAVTALVLLRQEVDDRRGMAPWRAPPGAACLSWQLPARILLTGGEPAWEFGPNLLVEAAHAARRCGFTPADGPRYLLASPEGARALLAVPPSGAVPLRQCGREVELSPRPGR